MSNIKSTLKSSIVLLVFFIGLNSVGNSKTNPDYISNKLQNPKNNSVEPEVGFIAYNKPYDILYTDGVYGNGNAVNKFEQSCDNPIDWDDFTLDFDFFTSKKREQWPIMMGRSNRSIGFLLKENMTIEVSANNQKQIFKTQGRYETNRWYHVKIVKHNNNSEIYLNEIKIGEFQIQIEEETKTYNPNNNDISSVNYSNGIAFDGGLRNIIYIQKGDFEFSKKMYAKYASKYNDKKMLFSKTDNLFQKTNEYKLFGLDWKSFKIQFDYIHSDDETKLILGDKWKVIDFHTINDTASISVNNNRISYLSDLKLIPKQKYKVEILVNNEALQMAIDDKVILNTNFEYYNERILERENEIFVQSKNVKPSVAFKSLIVQNSVSSKKIDPLCHSIERENNSIDTLNEGVLEALFIPPFELAIKENDSKDEFAFTKNISGFNTDSFEMNFDFLTYKKEEQGLIALGVYTKYSEIDLSIVNDNLVFKINNAKSTMIPIHSAKINGRWNKCKIVCDNGLLEIYLNNVKTYEIKYKLSNQFYNSKLLTIKNTFVGRFRNLYVYESAK